MWHADLCFVDCEERYGSPLARHEKSVTVGYMAVAEQMRLWQMVGSAAVAKPVSAEHAVVESLRLAH